MEVFILIASIVAAVVQFVFNRSLWADSAYLSLNIVGKSFSQLLEGLDFQQSAPIGFLWIERFIWQLFPGRDWSLKIVPLVCYMGSLLFFFDMLKHVGLTRMARCFSLVLFVTAIGPLYYSSEVKQYVVDLFASSVILWMSVAWDADDCRRRRLLFWSRLS